MQGFRVHVLRSEWTIRMVDMSGLRWRRRQVYARTSDYAGAMGASGSTAAGAAGTAGAGLSFWEQVRNSLRTLSMNGIAS